MPMTYATITGTITKPGSDIGVAGKLVATPGTRSAALRFSALNRTTLGPVVGSLDEEGEILNAAGDGPFQIPLNSDVANLVWKFTVQPKGPYSSPWELGNFEITETAEFASLDSVEITAVPSLPTVAGVLAEIQVLHDEVVAVGNTNDTIMAGVAADDDSDFKAVLDTSYARGVSATDPAFGLVGDGVAVNSTQLQALIDAVTAMPSWTTQDEARQIHLPAGSYVWDDTIDLHGFYGIEFVGEGRGNTVLSFTGSSKAAFSIRNAGYLTFRSMTLDCLSGIDAEATLFDLGYTSGDPTFKYVFFDVEFSRWWKAFDVTGSDYCCEVSFYGCRFSNGYFDLIFDNNQALNWNFYGVDFEARSQVTTKPLQDAAVFTLKQGTLVNVFGGSIVGHRTTVLYSPAASAKFARSSHGVKFDGTRFEFDTGGIGNALVRQASGAVETSNYLNITFRDTPVTFLVAVSDYYLAQLRNQWQLTLDNVRCTHIGRVVGIVDNSTGILYGNLRGIGLDSVEYEQDRTALSNGQTAAEHRVLMRYARVGATGTDVGIDRDILPPQNNGAELKRRIYRTLGGIIQADGATIPLPFIPDGSWASRFVVHKGATGSNVTYTIQNYSAAWAGSTAYALGDRMSNGGNVYRATTAGTSASSGGPSGTGAGITDGTVVWAYVAAASDTGAVTLTTAAQAGEVSLREYRTSNSDGQWYVVVTGSATTTQGFFAVEYI